MIAAAILVVLVAAISFAKFRLWRSRGAMMEIIDELRLRPLDVGELDRDELTGAFTLLTTIRDTYFDKPRKVRTDENRVREAWLQATIPQLRARYALLGEAPDASLLED